MAAVRVVENKPVKATLATTLTRLVPRDDVRVIWFSCDADCYLVYDNAKADGDAITAAEVHRIPANVVYPIEVNGIRPLVAAVSGTPTATFLGVTG